MVSRRPSLPDDYASPRQFDERVLDELHIRARLYRWRGMKPEVAARMAIEQFLADDWHTLAEMAKMAKPKLPTKVIRDFTSKKGWF